MVLQAMRGLIIREAFLSKSSWSGTWEASQLGGGGHYHSRALFLKKRDAFSIIIRTLLCSLLNLRATYPQCPQIPGPYDLCDKLKTSVVL